MDAQQFPSEIPAAAQNAERPRVETAGGVKVGRVFEDFGSFHLRLRILNALTFFCPYQSLNRVRTALYRWFGFEIGAGTVIMGGITFAGGGPIWRRLKIGKNCQITTPAFLDLNASITIGDQVALGHHVVLVTIDHEMRWPVRRCGKGSVAPIVIEDGCWIGACATILPGVTVGKGSVVAAGAVVTIDVPPNTLVGGIPAKPLKQLPEGGD